MTNLTFKELGQLGKALKVIKYEKIYKPSLLPKNKKKEIIFIGKSNVGKSSLINTLLNYKINKVSRTPGCTKWIGFLELPTINIIDLPGYGYSKVSQGRREFWDTMLSDYIREKRAHHVFILIDSRKKISELDRQVIEMFTPINCEIIYTKHDKPKEQEGFSVSVQSGKGIHTLREKILAL